MLPNSNLKIGIVGAGTAGLASAIALARAGHAVTVFEKHPSLTSLGAGLLMLGARARKLARKSKNIS